jgi:hypothetical protein
MSGFVVGDDFGGLEKLYNGGWPDAVGLAFTNRHMVYTSNVPGGQLWKLGKLATY